MDLITEAFEPAFMQRALLAGLIAVIATSLVGTWVVLRGLAFLGDALSHGVIPGIALAVLWGFSPIVGALAAALVMGGWSPWFPHGTLCVKTPGSGCSSSACSRSAS